MIGIVVVICFTLLLFKFTWVALRLGTTVLFNIIKIGMMLVLFIAATCNVYVYRAAGWTPMSAIFGGGIYTKSLSYLKKEHHVQR